MRDQPGRAMCISTTTEMQEYGDGTFISANVARAEHELMESGKNVEEQVEEVWLVVLFRVREIDVEAAQRANIAPIAVGKERVMLVAKAVERQVREREWRGARGRKLLDTVIHLVSTDGAEGRDVEHSECGKAGDCRHESGKSRRVEAKFLYREDGDIGEYQRKVGHLHLPGVVTE